MSDKIKLEGYSHTDGEPKKIAGEAQICTETQLSPKVEDLSSEIEGEIAKLFAGLIITPTKKFEGIVEDEFYGKRDLPIEGCIYENMGKKSLMILVRGQNVGTVDVLYNMVAKDTNIENVQGDYDGELIVLPENLQGMTLNQILSIISLMGIQDIYLASSTIKITRV